MKRFVNKMKDLDAVPKNKQRSNADILIANAYFDTESDANLSLCVCEEADVNDMGSKPFVQKTAEKA